MENVKPSGMVNLRKKQFKIYPPKIGQFIEIESLKQALTNGRYALMAIGGIQSSDTALDLVDAISYYSILLGKPFLDAYGVTHSLNLLNLDMDSGQELIDSYRDEFSPFYNTIFKRTDREEKVAKSETKEEVVVVEEKKTEEVTSVE